MEQTKNSQSRVVAPPEALRIYIGYSKRKTQIPVEWTKLDNLISVDEMSPKHFYNQCSLPPCARFVFAISPNPGEDLNQTIENEAQKLCNLFEAPICWIRIVNKYIDNCIRVKYISCDASGVLDGKSVLYIGVCLSCVSVWKDTKNPNKEIKLYGADIRATI